MKPIPLFRRMLAALLSRPVAVILATMPLASGGGSDVKALLAQLQSDDTDTRYEAMRQLGTAVDPRIPDACLSVLRKDGNSIRRLAARAIGRHWQLIPKERVPGFIDALKALLDSDDDGPINMARRGIALLSRKYDNAMVKQGEEYIDYYDKRILWNPERDQFSSLPDKIHRESGDGGAAGKSSPQEVKRHEIETNNRSNQ